MIFNKLKKHSLNSKSKFDIYYSNELRNRKRLNLSSPSPFRNGLKKFNILYVILSVIFAISFNKDVNLLVSILMALCASFLIINIIAAFKVDKLRSIEFNLSSSISKEQLIAIITLPLTQLNMKIENLSHYIRITHNKLQYDIIIYPDRNTFKIWPQKTLLSRLLARTYIKLYKNAILCMPIIAYTIQIEINKSINRL